MGNPSKRRLYICLDGVPYECMVEMQEKGHFREFYTPGKMISSFPSLTTIAFTEMLDTQPVVGYEDTYFNLNKNRLTGGMMTRLSRNYKNSYYHSIFDYEQPEINAGLGFILPRMTYLDDLRRFKRAFLSSKKEVTITYLASTDALGHSKGREGLLDFLEYLEISILEIKEQSKDRLEVCILSDHGNNLIDSTEAKIEEHLVQAGYRVGFHLKHEGDIVIPRYGLIGCAFAYTLGGLEREIAMCLSDCKEVDFSVFLSREGVNILGHNGEAKILQRGDEYAYYPEAGDLLALKPIIEHLKAEGLLNSEGYAPGEVWFKATRDHYYPDPLQRLVRAFCGNVQNQCNLYVNLKDGYFFGSRFFTMITRIKGTHGSLSSGSSVGFITADYREMPTHIQGKGVREIIFAPELNII